MTNQKTRLGLIIGIALVALLISLPEIPIKFKSEKFPALNIDTTVGGYKINAFGGKVNLDFSQLKEGLDIKGGIRVVLKADMSKIADSDKPAALDSAKTVIARRVDLLGVSEPVVQTSRVGDDFRIIVELPGVSDPAQAVNTIGKTAQLSFKQLKHDLAYDVSKFQEYFFDPSVWEATPVSGADLKGADVVFDQSSTSQGPQIRLRFSNEGRSKFSEVAKKNVNKPIAIFLDEGDLPLSMPVVNPDLAQGLTDDPVITGTFSTEEANNLSISLRAGALPVPVEIVEQKNIGATIGEESVRRSLIAGIVGIVIVSLFMIFSYGRLGVIAVIALFVYTVVSVAIFKAIPVTITLPGLAGFILSIGMAVDANILTFERIKEELSWGKPFNHALKLGFERAWPSIKDSNISSLITCAILFHFGTGLIKGFALTLALGILVSLFSAIFVTRTLILNLYHKENIR